MVARRDNPTRGCTRLTSDPEAVRRDLLYLREGAGYTPSRLAKCSALRSLLSGGREPEPVLRERLESAIDSLRDDDARVLRAVFALDDEAAPSLQARRDVVGAQYGIRREAVADRDAAAIDRLLVQLITGWYPKSPIPMPVPESHNAIVQYSVNVTTLVRDRKLFEAHHRYLFFPTFDAAEYVAISSATSDPPIADGNVTVRTKSVPGGSLHQFWFPSPLRRGQQYELKFRVLSDPDDEYWLTEEGLAFHEPTRFASFQVIFVGPTPPAIWKYSGLTSVERPGEPDKASALDYEQNSRVHAGFRDLYGGLFHGIAWAW